MEPSNIEMKGVSLMKRSEINKALQEGWSTAPDYVRQMGFGAGMGLPNMQKCSDEFDIQSQVGVGTTIVMKFKHQSEDL